jgi:hypothetical protein
LDAPQEAFYMKGTPDLMADVRAAMSRHGDFDPVPEHYSNDTNIFEILAVLEALAVEGEILS